MGSNGTTFWRFRIQIAIKQGPLSTHLEPTSHIGSAICSDIMWCTVLQWPICIGVYPRILKTIRSYIHEKEYIYIESIYKGLFIDHVSLEPLGLHLLFSPLVRSSTAGGQNSAAFGVVMPDYQVGHLVSCIRNESNEWCEPHSSETFLATFFWHGGRSHFRHLGLSEIWDLDSSIGLSSLSHYYLDSNGNLRLYIPFYTPFSDT